MGVLDLVLRITGVVLLAAVASLMWRARRPDHLARIGAALAASVAAFMLTSMPGSSQLLGVFSYPLGAICATHPVWFWLFCKALFSDRPKITVRELACVAAMAVGGLIYTGAVPSARTADPSAWASFAAGAFGAASLVFASLGPVAVYAGTRTELDARRRRIRAWFAPLVAAYIATVVVTQLFVIFGRASTPKPLVIVNLLVIDAVAIAALLSFVQIRVFNWFDLVEPAPHAERLSRLERSVLERLTRRFSQERLYAREGLSIAMLGELLGTQEHVLRRVINQGLGFRNFNDFLHSHRLREASARLLDPAARDIPILTIALEAGYGSIGPFNRAFRERFGMTPGEYRRTASAEPAAVEQSAISAHPSPLPRA